MSWYTAHLVMYFRWREGDQDHFPVWENIVLIQAGSVEEAFAKAEQRGKDDAAYDDESLRYGNRPETLEFAGVRALVACDDADERPGDGTEVSYVELELNSRQELDAFVEGKRVAVVYTEPFSDEDTPPEAAEPAEHTKGTR
jgi:hypothetical protein